MTSDLKTDLEAARSTSPVHSILGLPAKLLEVFHARKSAGDESISYGTLKFLAVGKSGIVYAIDRKRVLKEYHDSDGAEVERRAYGRVSPHPNIATLSGIQRDGSLILERGETLREIYKTCAADKIPIQTKLCWLADAANGYKHAHDHGIVLADVGCHNLILSREGGVKIIDFEGCSIDGEGADSCYEWFSYRPSTPRVSHATNIFAYGCAAYEVMTGRTPYHELEANDDKYRQVEELYLRDQFPDVTNLPLSGLIQGCWQGSFSSMAEVVKELEVLRASSRIGNWISQLLSALPRIFRRLLARCFQQLVKPVLVLFRHCFG